jgi:hypothetical protein
MTLRRQARMPAAWAKEAKDLWPTLPPAVQQAAIKREADMLKGVDAPKAQHCELDTPLARTCR